MQIPFRYSAFLSQSHLPPESHSLHSTKVVLHQLFCLCSHFSCRKLLKSTATGRIYVLYLCLLALLPPVNRIRPRSPPPPPPTNSAEARLPKSPQSRPKVIEQLENSEEVKKAVKPTPFYGNAEIHNKASTRDFPAQLTSRKTGTRFTKEEQSVRWYISHSLSTEGYHTRVSKLIQ